MQAELTDDDEDDRVGGETLGAKTRSPDCYFLVGGNGCGSGEGTR